MKIYSRCESTDYGGDVSLALEACQRRPEQWTTRLWGRPFGNPGVEIPHNFEEMATTPRLEEIATAIVGDRTADKRSAIEIVRAYVSGAQHPGGGIARATPHKEDLAAAIIADRSAA
jgi:hypothetical protein